MTEMKEILDSIPLYVLVFASLIIFAVVGFLLVLFLDRWSDQDKEDGDEEEEKE